MPGHRLTAARPCPPLRRPGADARRWAHEQSLPHGRGRRHPGPRPPRRLSRGHVGLDLLGRGGPAAAGAGHLGPGPAAPCDPAQLPRARARPLPAGVHPPRDPAVLHREEHRGQAVQPRPALDRLRPRQGPGRSQGLRHGEGHRRDRLRVPAAHHRPGSPGRGAADGARGRAGLRSALRDAPDEHLLDVLRLAVEERRAGHEQGRGHGRVRARDRRGRADRVPPRQRRRPVLGDRLRVLRLPVRRRALQPRALRREGPLRRGQGHHDQAVPGRQARPGRRAAGLQGHRRDC